MIGGLKKLQKWNRNKWERERSISGWSERSESYRPEREWVRESESVREGSEKIQRGVLEHAMKVVGAAVVSILSLNHLQVSFSSLPTIFPSSMSFRMCVVGEPCNFLLHPWSLLCSVVIPFCFGGAQNFLG